VVNVIDCASAIQATWLSISSSIDHVIARDASMITRTRIVMLMRR